MTRYIDGVDGDDEVDLTLVEAMFALSPLLREDTVQIPGQLGPIDVLGRDYDALLPRSIEIGLGERRLRVLDLEMLVELERGSTRRKDKLMLPVLEAALRRRDGFRVIEMQRDGGELPATGRERRPRGDARWQA